MSETKTEQTKKPSLIADITKTSLKRLIYCAVLLSVCFSAVLLLNDQIIGIYVRQNIYDKADEIPFRPYGIVLGTSKYAAPNTPNLFYNNRLNAAKELYELEKINYLLLSGDNRTPYYNEPRAMARDLEKMGVNGQILFPDYAGFRTLDSIIRAKEVFKAEPMTIITQRFHCERALFIAYYHNIDAICFTAADPDVYTLTRLREVFARFLMLWELFIQKQPHFLGEPIPLPTQK